MNDSSKFDLIWGRVVRVTSFMAGVAIMGFETVGDSSDRPWLYAAAIGMMGLPIARAAEGTLARFGSSGPGSDEGAPPAKDDLAARRKGRKS